MSENVFPARRGHLSIILEAVNVVPFFQYLTVMLKLAEKKLTFFSAPLVGVLYEPPGPTVGHLQPFQTKKNDKCPGGMDTLGIDQFRYIKIPTLLRGLGEHGTSIFPIMHLTLFFISPGYYSRPKRN